MLNYTHPGQPQMQVEMILASVGNDTAPPIYTIRLRYPRIIHGEIMTHRVFSRNARSSRAVPVQTMLNEVRNTPFVPWHWGRQQKGMQAGEDWDQPIHFECDGVYFSGATREQLWLHARDTAADVAEAYMEADYHKQIPNRLLEPFSWMDTLITSTQWSNFLWLRDHEAAEPHLQDLARLVKDCIDEADPVQLPYRGWHLPYITNDDRAAAVVFAQEMCWSDIEVLQKISAARCARISYKPFDGDASYQRELERYDSLVKSDRVHASPTEHQAQSAPAIQTTSGIKFMDAKLSGNLGPGWVQFRKLIPNECS